MVNSDIWDEYIIDIIEYTYLKLTKLVNFKTCNTYTHIDESANSITYTNSGV